MNSSNVYHISTIADRNVSTTKTISNRLMKIDRTVWSVAMFYAKSKIK